MCEAEALWLKLDNAACAPGVLAARRLRLWKAADRAYHRADRRLKALWSTPNTTKDNDTGRVVG